MTATIIIPARLGSTRFPGKVLADRTGRPMIRHVVEAARRARSAGRVVVATDEQRVADAVAAFGGEAVMTSRDHPNGTSRLAEASRLLGLDPDSIVVNVQGDEPELEPHLVDAAVEMLRSRPWPMATVALPFLPEENAADPNLVKVVVRENGSALYFSRAVIPHRRDPSGFATPPLKHVGLYVYRRGFLDTYLALAPTPLERTEQLEQLRVLGHGYEIGVAVGSGRSFGGIDTPEQYEAFVRRWNSRQAGA